MWKTRCSSHPKTGRTVLVDKVGKKENFQSDRWSEGSPLWIFTGLFFSSRISTWGPEERRPLFPFSFLRLKPEKSVDPQLRLNSAFLVASGRLSFVNVLWPLYYLVCIILKANQLWNATEELLIIVFLLCGCVRVCVCVCVSIDRYDGVCVCKMMVTWMEHGKWDQILTRYIVHFEEMIPANASSVFLMFLTQRSECFQTNEVYSKSQVL